MDPKVVAQRIRDGKARRSHLKKGVASTFITTCAFAGVATQMLPSQPMNRPDLLEVFAGHAEVSSRFANWGWQTAEAVDILYGTDLRDEHTRHWLLSWIESQKPRLVLVAYPCKLWSILTNIQHSTGQERRRLFKLRKQELPFLELCEAIFELHIKLGGDALGENPLHSASFTIPPIARTLAHPQVYSSVGHGCRFGVKHARNHLPLLKPTLWFSTSVEICGQLAKRCLNEKHPGHHQHGTYIGGNDVTERTGHYTKGIARAIHDGFVQLLKWKEPGRVRVMLRSVSAKIRRTKARDGSESVSDLRWTERSFVGAWSVGPYHRGIMSCLCNMLSPRLHVLSWLVKPRVELLDRQIKCPVRTTSSNQPISLRDGS